MLTRNGLNFFFNFCEQVLCNSYFDRNLEFLHFKNGLLNQVFDLIAIQVFIRVCVCICVCISIYLGYVY